MRSTAFPLLFVTCLAFACEDVPIDDTRSDSRLVPPTGVIQGTVLYEGPHPCSSGGHIIGNTILLFFDAADPPPPKGLATTALNFGVVTGDTLFPDEARWSGSDIYCPKDHGVTSTISVGAPFAVSPFAAGAYVLVAFYDYTGDFLPTFKFRNLPEAGDVAGGYIDTADAAMHAGDPDYGGKFLPIPVGVPKDDGSLAIPPDGYVAGGVAVTLGEVVPLPRPYVYPDQGDQPAPFPVATSANPSGDPNYVPVVLMPQDIQVDAPPAAPTPQTIATFQSKFPLAKLVAGVPAKEQAAAIDPTKPFHFQLSPPTPSLFVWNSGQIIPEGNLVPELYPLVVFDKLVDDPGHTLDPQSLITQGGASGPIVVILGITLGPSDSLFDSVLSPPGNAPGPTTASNHVSALVRPSALCVDPSQVGVAATLVTPFLTGPSADPTEMVPPGGKPLFDQKMVLAALAPVFGVITVKQGCLPPGRYSMNVVYPSGQAWTVPNEAGSCAAAEGTIDPTSSPLPTCSAAPRDILYSQGTRGVLEVTSGPVPSPTCVRFPVPAECGGAP